MSAVMSTELCAVLHLSQHLYAGGHVEWEYPERWSKTLVGSDVQLLR